MGQSINENGGRTSASTMTADNMVDTGATISDLPMMKSDFDAGKMTYQCDGNLGTGGPDPVDCEKLSWSGLSNDFEEKVELRKGVPRFWSEGVWLCVILSWSDCFFLVSL